MKVFALHDSDANGGYSAPTRRDDYEPADYCSREGAAKLKAKIEAYWRERGQEITVSMHNVGFHPAIRAARYDVRSDMINGLPRSAVKKTPSAAEGTRDPYAGSYLDLDDEDEVYLD